MYQIINIVAPVIILTAIGYGSVKSKWVSEKTGDGLVSFVFNMAIPILLFLSLANGTWTTINPWAVWIAYLPAIVVAWVSGTIIVVWGAGRDAKAGIIAGVSAGFSNLVLVAIPLVDRAYGQEGLEILFLLVAAHLPVMMTISTVLMEINKSSGSSGNRTIRVAGVAVEITKNIVRNPIILGIVAGVVWGLAGPKIVGMPSDILTMIAETATPLALIALGMNLTKYNIHGNWKPAVPIAVVSVVVMPAIALGSSMMLNVSPLTLKVVVLAAACPTGVNAWLIASWFKTATGLASSTIIITALLSVLTLPVWLKILEFFG